MARFGAILTNYGNAAITRAFLTGRMVSVNTFALGDAGGAYYQPDPAMTELRGEKWRTSLGGGEINTLGNKVTFYGTIPPELDGFTIRETGVFDEDGYMVAVCNTPEIEKVAFEEGVALDGRIAMEVEVVHAEVIKFVIDPYTAIATMRDIELHNENPAAHPDIRAQFGSHYTKAEADALLLNKANLGQAQRFPFPFTSGYTSYAGSYYYRTQFEELVLNISVKRSAGDAFPSSSMLIGTLPQGFRPAFVIEQSVITNTKIGGSSYLSKDGNVTLFFSGTPTGTHIFASTVVVPCV